MIQRTVERMYTETEENRFLEVTYANGDKEVLYFKDFNSGAMIENIVDRAKKMAIKDFLDTGQKGLRMQHLLAACVDEFKENEDLPEHHQPRRLGADLRQEGRADRLHPHAHLRQAGRRGRPLDRHRREHRPVPLTARLGGQHAGLLEQLPAVGHERGTSGSARWSRSSCRRPPGTPRHLGRLVHDLAVPDQRRTRGRWPAPGRRASASRTAARCSAPRIPSSSASSRRAPSSGCSPAPSTPPAQQSWAPG